MHAETVVFLSLIEYSRDGKSMAHKKMLKASKKLKQLDYTFIFNNKLHYNISTFSLLLNYFKKFKCRFVKNILAIFSLIYSCELLQ